jgi:protein-L-isoaspartate(D-aspartate) O-methyltransferase
MNDYQDLREAMIERQLRVRGITDERVLQAMATVPREQFVPRELAEFAYADSALPIDEGQTISQPFIVAQMAQALELGPGDIALDVGTGSAYAAAVLSRIVDRVYSIERRASLVKAAAKRLNQLAYNNVHLRHGDGTQGWPEHAPYDGIQVAAAGEDVPGPLKEQLAIGGHLVIPVGKSGRIQDLLRLTKRGPEDFEEQEMGAVRFVPLVHGASIAAAEARTAGASAATLTERLARSAQDFSRIDEAPTRRFIKRTSSARVVLLGEATHGTSEFYRMRAHLTKELIRHHNVRFVAVEADWPDAAQIDQYVRGTDVETGAPPPFQRFPTWMWANQEGWDFGRWLLAYNQDLPPEDNGVAFYGLDLYSMNCSIAAVLEYLDDVDPEAAAIARQRYGCLSPWEQNPAAYGAAALQGGNEACEPEVVANLKELLERRIQFQAADGYRFLNAVQNARLVANAEEYYRAMCHGSHRSWNLRDQHMFDTLTSLLSFHGEEARGIVWEHNSHIGDARATEMSSRGEHIVGQLSRQEHGDSAYLVGFGTDHALWQPPQLGRPDGGKGGQARAGGEL